MKYAVGFLLYCLFTGQALCQSNKQANQVEDSLRIRQVEDGAEPDKVLHAEPLYIDLLRDLGARKGEKEWNFGFGLTDRLDFDEYEALVEYEFAPINRLGLEVELPFTFYSARGDGNAAERPSNRLDALKMGLQWSFFVSEKIATSMAIGYLNELEFSAFDNFGNPLFIGNIYNPIFIVAKRWGSHFHTLLYSGVLVEQHFKDDEVEVAGELNYNFHYMVPGTNNFIGLEVNQIVGADFNGATLRPQMRLNISHDLLIGIVVGIPVRKENERMSGFLRLIWEPGG